ncbi:copper resistance CopC family protein [Dyella sp. 20L07]|uniref:copper resistance CopC family protein n=1 Tax=Dyella sp. 20L07 TaxID=3384240 RepID=UPI003D2B7A63
MRTLRRYTSLTFVIVTMFASMTAGAHAILTDSTPKPNGNLPAGHASFVLKYNSKIDQERSRLVMVAPDHSETPLHVAADASKPNELDSEAEVKPGAYVIRWQALALDGHITRGELPFTVIAAAP